MLYIFKLVREFFNQSKIPIAWCLDYVTIVTYASHCAEATGCPLTHIRFNTPKVALEFESVFGEISMKLLGSGSQCCALLNWK